MLNKPAAKAAFYHFEIARFEQDGEVFVVLGGAGQEHAAADAEREVEIAAAGGDEVICAGESRGFFVFGIVQRVEVGYLRAVQKARLAGCAYLAEGVCLHEQSAALVTPLEQLALIFLQKRLSALFQLLRRDADDEKFAVRGLVFIVSRAVGRDLRAAKNVQSQLFAGGFQLVEIAQEQFGGACALIVVSFAQIAHVVGVEVVGAYDAVISLLGVNFRGAARIGLGAVAVMHGVHMRFEFIRIIFHLFLQAYYSTRRAHMPHFCAKIMFVKKVWTIWDFYAMIFMEKRGDDMAIINYSGKNLRTYEVSRHKHDFWEFIYCTGGDGTVTFEDGRELDYTQHQLVLVPPGVMHANQSERGFKNIHMTISGWTPPFKTPQLLDDNSHRDLYTVMSMCYRYFNTNIQQQPKLMISLTELLLNMLSAFSGTSGNSHHVENMANMIVDNFSDPSFCIDEIYRDIPLSKDYLRRQFIKEKGISPLQFLNHTRINYAQKLLLSRNINNYKIYEIAEMCGFTDQLYFSRVFKKISGVSPKAFCEKED